MYEQPPLLVQLYGGAIACVFVTREQGCWTAQDVQAAVTARGGTISVGTVTLLLRQMEQAGVIRRAGGGEYVTLPRA